MLKTVLRIPGVRPVVRSLLYDWQCMRLWCLGVEGVFSAIAKRNTWHGDESVSGRGSSLAQTEAIRRALPTLFSDFGIRSVLDLPCGDFRWMRHVDLSTVKYIGADIVRPIVESNRAHETPAVRFTWLNLLESDLPKADLVLCRDCLVHFSFSDALTALRNIASSATYLLCTTFTARAGNRDIATGHWRPLNMELAPFNFPEPLRLIIEHCSEQPGYEDKSLGLWRVGDLKLD